jgi:hypothetical protein
MTTLNDLRQFAQIGQQMQSDINAILKPQLPATMPAITIWQPWASAIACGLKQFETRHWRTNYRGFIAIHAAKKWDKNLEHSARYLTLQIPELALHFDIDNPVLCGVIAVAKLVDCVPTNDGRGRSRYECLLGDWQAGRYAWQMDVVQVFDTPIPAVGKQGLWRWERD